MLQKEILKFVGSYVIMLFSTQNYAYLYRLLAALPSRKKTLSITGLVKEWKKLLNKYVDNYVSKVITNHNRADQKMEQIQPYVLQLHFVVTV